MSTPEPGPMENIVRGLDEQASLLNPAELKAELEVRGLDVEGFLARTRSLISSHKKEERTAWMKVADERKTALSSMLAAISDWTERGEAEIRSAFATLSTGPNAIAFRKKGDEIPVTEMARILNDFEKLNARPSQDQSEAE